MNANKNTRRSLLTVVFAVMIAAICLFACACSTGGESGSQSASAPSQSASVIDITGPEGDTVLEGYSSFSSEKFNVSGDNVEVTANIPASAEGKIEWSGESLRLFISGGLSVGTYEVVLTAKNGKAKDKTVVYTLVVEECDPPKITIENDCLYLIEGYSAVTSEEFLVTGTHVSVTVTCNDKNAKEKISWNDLTKRLEIAEGLPMGSYTVVLTASNGTPAMNAVVEYKLFVTPVPRVEGKNRIDLSGEDYETAVYTYLPNAKNVTIEKRGGSELVVWNKENGTLTINAGLPIGEHKVELVASNGNAAYDSVFEIIITVKRLYTVTGGYEYGSGRYDATNGRFINDGDGNVRAKIGEIEAFADENGQTYTLERVPEGEYTITVESDLFLPAEIVVNVSGDNDVVSVEENAVLKNPKMVSETGVIYSENGYVTIAGDTAALFAGSPAANAGEGFVVKYSVPGNGCTGWFNRGGLHVETDATERNKHDFGLVNTGKKWGVYVKQSGVDERANMSLGFADFAVSDVWAVTVVYYDGAYYMSYVSADESKAYSTAYLAQSFTFVKGGEIVSKTATRTLGLSSYCDDNYGTIFSDVSYAIGNEIAKQTIENLPNPEFDFTVSAGTRVALPRATAENGEGFVINYTVYNNGSAIDKNRGGLYMLIGGKGYRFDMHKTTGFYVGDSSTADGYDYYTKNSAGGTLDTGSGDWKVTIAFYNGAYYLRFRQGETTYTKKIDSSFTGGGTTAAQRNILYSKTATRELWLHSFTSENKANTQFGKVTYTIGNDAATAAIGEMGL